MYHVVLHPEAEVSEVVYWDAAPRGSLLVWLDDFFTRPVHLVDRTAGRYENLMPSLHDTPVEFRKRVFVRVMDHDAVDQPQRHGDFTEPQHFSFRFWRPEDWFPGKPTPHGP
jgi:hypothetical protein